MGILTNNEMARVIREGGSVLFQGRHYNRIEALPNDAQIAAAVGDADRETAATNVLKQQIAAMQAQLDEVQAGQARRQEKAPAAAEKDTKKEKADTGKE